MTVEKKAGPNKSATPAVVIVTVLWMWVFTIFMIEGVLWKPPAGGETDIMRTVLDILMSFVAWPFLGLAGLFALLIAYPDQGVPLVSLYLATICWATLKDIGTQEHNQPANIPDDEQRP